MYWLRRPPYARWIVAGCIVVAAVAFDARPTPTVQYPFASADLAPGERIEESLVWHEVPAGILPAWTQEPEGRVAAGLAAGDPIVPSSIDRPVVPNSWWAVQLPLPSGVAGTRLRVILSDGHVAEGIVVEASSDMGFEPLGLVAFSPTDAPLVATAVRNDALTVMVGVGSGVSDPNG
jgi:hypothetical protein